MSIDMVFNELSALPTAADAYAAQLRVSIFVRTLGHARRENVTGAFRVPENFYTLILAPNYSLINWTNDRQVDREERLFLKTLATKLPFLVDLPIDADKANLYDFKVDAEAAKGCGYAFLLDAVSISFQSDTRWNVDRLQVTVEQITEDGNIEITDAEIVHASSASHINQHRDWIRNRLNQGVESGADLWARRSELFPSLSFCEAVERQVLELEQGTAMLQPVIKHLSILEAYCKTWTAGAFEPANIPGRVSPESQKTLELFDKERTFRCPDGAKRVFSWHLKITVNAWRIHFHFDNANPSALLIGYIGKHLSTANDRT